MHTCSPYTQESEAGGLPQVWTSLDHITRIFFLTNKQTKTRTTKEHKTFIDYEPVPRCLLKLMYLEISYYKNTHHEVKILIMCVLKVILVVWDSTLRLFLSWELSPFPTADVGCNAARAANTATMQRITRVLAHTMRYQWILLSLTFG